MAGTIGRAVGAFVIGALLAYFLVLIGTAILWDMLGVVDRDGGGAMAIAFFIAPLIALLAGAGAAFWAVRRANAARTGNAAPAAAAHPAFGAAVGGLLLYLPTKFLFWLVLGTNAYDHCWKSLAHAWAPFALALLGAVAGWFLVQRKRSR